MQRSGEQPVEDSLATKKANSRLLFIWGWAQETDRYVKRPWSDLHGRLKCGDDPEVILREAELLYEACQTEEWPSQF